MKTWNKIWLPDAGHGGVSKEGRYYSAPLHMFTHLAEGPHRQFTMYEGEINRKIQDKLVILLQKVGITYFKMAHETFDTPTVDRVQKANGIYNASRNAVYLSIHSASGGGNGFAVCPSSKKSELYADVFSDCYTQGFPQKETKTVTKEVSGLNPPAVRVENLFFDNRQEALFLNSEQGQNQIAETLFEAIKRCDDV